jgi:hypothetical protein
VRLLLWLGSVLSSIMTKGPLRSCHHLQMIIMTTTVYQPKWIIGADALIDDRLLEDCQTLVQRDERVGRQIGTRHRVGDAGGGVACLVGEAEPAYGEQSVITDIGGARHEQDAVGETSSQPDHRLLRRSFQCPSSPYLSGCRTFGRGSSAASS